MKDIPKDPVKELYRWGLGERAWHTGVLSECAYGQWQGSLLNAVFDFMDPYGIKSSEVLHPSFLNGYGAGSLLNEEGFTTR